MKTIKLFLCIFLSMPFLSCGANVPKYLNLEQFKTVLKASDLSFWGTLKYAGMQIMHNSSSGRVIPLYISDIEGLECRDSSKVYDNYALLVKNISESEFVWQELLVRNECALLDSLSKLQESNWKQFSGSSNEYLGKIKEAESWGEDSIHIIVARTYWASKDGTFEEFLMECYEIENLNEVPSTSLCVQMLSKQ